MNMQQEHRNLAIADDASFISKGSAEAVNMILNEAIDIKEDTMILEFDFNEKDGAVDGGELEGLMDPLDDLENDDDDIKDVGRNETKNESDNGENKSETQPSQWQTVFEPETGDHRMHMIPASVSQDSSSSVSTLEETVISLEDDDVASLMNGEILEPKFERPVTAGWWDTRGAPPPTGDTDLIRHMIGYLQHTERDQKVFLEADRIVRECHFNHHSGDHRFQNLAGCIFERLIKLLGADKFHDIYHRVKSYSYRQYHDHHHQYPWSYVSGGPGILELGIAYGIHLARTHQDQSTERPLHVIQKGASTLYDMKEDERAMFWNYMTGQGK
ncbi:expressed unknown protein [Seminavis robusta]|uniref:Uncharacterized protein n=1 Tax=Seminavis robusta TaxID=568900 RepID=A0A9N8F1G4_9STRA|nr:expressed unknown protein [Seminavis robusta]|eukprot:Sro2628_g333030.1 n/a (329) ;mRNA; r:8095-9081